MAGFASKLKVTCGDIEVGIDYEAEPGLADNGDLEHDLQALFEQAGAAAQAANTAVAGKVSSLAPTRSSLIAKGMIWSPNFGDTAFTVPMFDQFMKRIMRWTPPA